MIYYSITILLSSIIIEYRMPAIAFRTLVFISILIGGGLFYVFSSFNPPMIGAGCVAHSLDGAIISIWLKVKSNFKRWEKIYALICIVSFINSIIFKDTIFSLMNYIALSTFFWGFCFIMILSKCFKVELKEGYNFDLQATRFHRA